MESISSGRITWIFDIETLTNCTVFVFVSKDSDEYHHFVLHNLCNQDKELRKFIHDQVKGLIGFNNLSFDNVILDYFLTEYPIPSQIYNKAQEIIETERVYHTPSIRSLDLFKLWHFDNAAKHTSLKDLEFVMKRKKILDMPIHHTTYVETLDQINTIIEYCLEDCLATKQFYELSSNEIRLRQTMSKKYGIDLLNASHSSMGESIFIHYISEKTGISEREIRRMGTDRPLGVSIKDILLPHYSHFTHATFKKLVNKMNRLHLMPDSKYEESLIFNGMEYQYGKGGLHGAIPDYYQSDDQFVIKTCDVVSYYPRMGIVNKQSPAHFGDVFWQVYDILFEERRKYPKGTDENYGIKISLNAVFGKTNDKWSCLRDLMYFYFITINGQLQLSLLADWYAHAGFKVIMANTDGLEVIIPKNKEDVYRSISQKWMKLTGLELEFDNYASLLVRDVNNYISLTQSGKIKVKGAYEIDKDLWKDHSFRIVPLAVLNYFINQVPITQTIDGTIKQIVIKDRTYDVDDFDYFGRLKINKDFEAVHRTLELNQLVETPLSKTTRYYVSKSGSSITKIKKEDKNETRIQAGYNTYPFNHYTHSISNDLNLSFYIKEAQKLIDPIEMKKTQMSLF